MRLENYGNSTNFKHSTDRKDLFRLLVHAFYFVPVDESIIGQDDHLSVCWSVVCSKEIHTRRVSDAITAKRTTAKHRK